MAAEEAKPRRRRRRVDADGNASTVTKTAKTRGETRSKPAAQKLYEIPEGAVYEITAQASELVPVAQYANVTVGPVMVTRQILIPDPNDIPLAIEAALKEIQDVVENVVSEDRDIVQESVASYNREKAEQEKAKSSGKS